MLTFLDRLLSAFSNTLPAAATGMPRLTGYPLGPSPRPRFRQGPRRRRSPKRVQPPRLDMNAGRQPTPMSRSRSPRGPAPSPRSGGVPS